MPVQFRLRYVFAIVKGLAFTPHLVMFSTTAMAPIRKLLISPPPDLGTAEEMPRAGCRRVTLPHRSRAPSVGDPPPAAGGLRPRRFRGCRDAGARDGPQPKRQVPLPRMTLPVMAGSKTLSNPQKRSVSSACRLGGPPAPLTCAISWTIVAATWVSASG